jgi:hypothetical protein
VLCAFGEAIRPEATTVSNPQQNKLGEMERQLRHFSRLLLGEQNRSAQLCDSSMRALNRGFIRQIEKQIEGSEELSAKARKLTAVSGVHGRSAVGPDLP